MSDSTNTTPATEEQQQQDGTENSTINNTSPDKSSNAKSPRPHRKVSYRARTASNANNTPNAASTTQLNSEERQKSVHVLTDTMFQDVSLLIKGEMQLGFNDLKLLENMNQTVAKKYENMTGRGQQVKEHVTKMKQSCICLTLLLRLV